MSELLLVGLRLVVFTAPVGALVGWLMLRTDSARWRVAAVVAVLIGCAVLLVLTGSGAASPSQFAPVQFLIGALAAAPVVAIAAGVCVVSLWLRATGPILLVASAIGGALASPAVVYMAIASACAFAGDCP